jgi:alpha-ketoglutarate-dependent taurine dioxygenase
MTQLQTRPLKPEFGVEVLGLQPKIPLSDDDIKTLKALFDAHSLLVFRDIDIDLKFQAYLSELLIGNDPLAPDAPPPVENFYVSNERPSSAAPFGRLMYHSDSQWSKERCDLLSLYGEKVEQPSVPTMFVSSADAWDTLPESLRERVKNLVAVHMHDDETYLKRAAGDDQVLVNSYGIGANSNKLPIVFTHPRTGRTLLYVSQQMTYGIDGMAREESEELLEALFNHSYASGKELAHHWRERDLVIWDNLALQHARPNVNSDGPARTENDCAAPAHSGHQLQLCKSRSALASTDNMLQGAWLMCHLTRKPEAQNQS